MTTIELWVGGEHYVLDRDQWEELTDGLGDEPVHALPDGELEDRLDDVDADPAPVESTA
jgi:hypothetical protein